MQRRRQVQSHRIGIGCNCEQSLPNGPLSTLRKTATIHLAPSHSMRDMAVCSCVCVGVRVCVSLMYVQMHIHVRMRMRLHAMQCILHGDAWSIGPEASWRADNAAQNSGRPNHMMYRIECVLPLHATVDFDAGGRPDFAEWQG